MRSGSDAPSGPPRPHVAFQCVSEAALLALIGGAVGAISGGFFTTIYAAARRWYAVIPRAALGGATAAAVVVGAVAGVYPAIRAAAWRLPRRFAPFRPGSAFSRSRCGSTMTRTAMRIGQRGARTAADAREVRLDALPAPRHDPRSGGDPNPEGRPPMTVRPMVEPVYSAWAAGTRKRHRLTPDSSGVLPVPRHH